MSNDPLITKAVIQATILGWHQSHIINLIYKEYKADISYDDIRHIREENESLIYNYQNQLLIGNYSIHKRIIKFGKKNSLNCDIVRITNEPHDLQVVSNIIYIINKFSKISFTQIENLYSEYFEKPKFDLNKILIKLEIPDYTKDENGYTAITSSNSDFNKINKVNHLNTTYRIIFDDRIYIDTYNHELHLIDDFSPVKFTISALTICELKSDPHIRAFIDEIIARS
jgi:hypothetical protein